MGRLVASASISCALLFLLGLAGCGKGPGTSALAIPGGIVISPGTTASLDIGGIQPFSASLRDFQNRVIAGETVSWQSSNAAVLTVANNGLACAGTWNSLASPQICTPGPAGTAQVTANSMGVTSAPTTVYVHPHVDNVTVSLVPANPPSTAPCISKGLTADYQATALSRGVDVTSTVGPFSWTAFNPTVLMLNNAISGLALNQVRVTGNQPGDGQIVAAVAGVNSVPLQVQTCLVQSISLKVTATGATSFTVNAGGSAPLTPTVIDTQGNQITGVPLTWSTSDEGVVTINATSGAISTPNPGGAAITASCTPPTCNVGVFPVQAIYSDNVIRATVTRAAGSNPSGTVWVTSDACSGVSGCSTALFSIAFPADSVTTETFLPAAPNSLVFNPTGTTGFLGTDQSVFGTKGLMILTPTATPTRVSSFTSVSGKILAVSNDGNRLIMSNTVDTPNQVFIVDTSNTTAGINSTPLQITGATAAAFSPDGLKAYILAGTKLYVQSTVEPLQTISLASSPSAVSFLSEGAFAYIAGETPNSVTVRKTCDNTVATDASNNPQVIATPGTLFPMQTLPDATQVVGVSSPGIDLIPVGTIGVATAKNVLGCTPSTASAAGFPNISNGTPSFFNLGQGSFTPTQLLISSDSTRAYVLTSSLPSVLVFDIGNQSSSSIALTGAAVPLRADITLDGTMLAVGGSDGLVHLLDTSTGADVAQVAFPSTTALCVDSTGKPFVFNPPKACNPDLIAIRP